MRGLHLTRRWAATDFLMTWPHCIKLAASRLPSTMAAASLAVAFRGIFLLWHPPRSGSSLRDEGTRARMPAPWQYWSPAPVCMRQKAQEQTGSRFTASAQGELWLGFRAIPRRGGFYGDCFPNHRSPRSHDALQAWRWTCPALDQSVAPLGPVN